MVASRLLVPVMVVAAAWSLSSCQNRHLTRSNAKAQLERMVKSAQARAPHSILVQIGRVTDCEPTNGVVFDPVEKIPETAILLATGFLTATPIKPHVWNVELTDRGKQSIEGEKYAHDQKGDCDEWQVTLPLAKYDHLDVTGIIEEGVHAKVDVELTYLLTPVAIEARKVAHDIVIAQDTKTYGKEFAEALVNDKVSSLLSTDIAYLPQNARSYTKKITVEFAKYDDGWKPLEK